MKYSFKIITGAFIYFWMFILLLVKEIFSKLLWKFESFSVEQVAIYAFDDYKKFVGINDLPKKQFPEAIISCGQMGIDLVALNIARGLEIRTGGNATKQYRVEDGINGDLRDFGLIEHSSDNYLSPTRLNIRQSSGTVLFGNENDSEIVEIENICKRENKIFIRNPSASDLKQWIIENKVKVLNVTGSWRINLSEEQITQYSQVLSQALRKSRCKRLLSRLKKLLEYKKFSKTKITEW